MSTRSSPAMLRRSCAALEASRSRSSSSWRYLSNSATTSRGFRRLPSADRRSTHPAIRRMRARSFSMTGSMFGRSTLTATSRPASRPPRRVAKCTWAMEALATGTRSKWLNTSSTRRPKARSMVAMAISLGNGGTRSCRRASSSAMSGGSRSRRVDSTWPNFTKMGPRRSSASRRRWPRGLSRWRPVETMRVSRRIQGWSKLESTSSSSPYRSTTQTMKQPRRTRLIGPRPRRCRAGGACGRRSP